MSFLVIPSIIALLIKFAVLYAASQSRKSAQHASQLTDSETGETKRNATAALGIFTTMVMVMAGHNLAELLGYIEFTNGTFQDGILRWYYLMTVGSLLMMVFYAKTISGLQERGSRSNTLTNITVVSISAILAGFIMFSELIVAGSHTIGYSMTADHGAYYWLFRAFSLSSFALIIVYLVLGYAKADQHQTEIQCGYTLIALAPIVLTSLSLLLLMKLGYQVNAALVMPLASAAFLLITLKGEKAHGILDVRRHIPLSLERKTSAQIMDIFSQYAQDTVNYRDALSEIEKLLVTHKHQKHGGNVSSTAASMELPRSSLYSIFRRLEIDLKDDK